MQVTLRVVADNPDRSMAASALLLTRPECQSRRFAAGLECERVVISPVIRVELREAGPLPPDIADIIFTSENAIAGAGAGRRAWCVGDRTAAAARAAGYEARSAGGDAGSLVALILQEAGDGPFLHLRGAHTRGDVAARLQAAGLNVAERVVYDQIAQPLTPEARRLLAEPGRVVVPLFSPRSAGLLAAQLGDVQARLLPVAISAATAAEWRSLRPGPVIVSEAPDAAAMRVACQSALSAGGAP
ncbi:uroporphyrinogen-III synthase [Halodurantibacterium flavum]|uniref:Uroporphyrinogen-III synthase n=1 Tax=Halodurantibacterium flavum TaxID=1382802 RepID=A0ABW4S9P8_9RHOB